MERAYDLRRPERRTTATVFSSPHSGRDYPDALLQRSVLAPKALRSSEDAFVDRLIDAAPRHGAPLLAARWPRAWVDLNRAEDELDPALIEGRARGGHNPRVASGLGVVPRVVAGGRAIYSGKIAAAEACERIETAWRPYHDALGDLLDGAHRRYGLSILLDCHSMPREALEGVRANGRRPEVVLGDRYGASAAGWVVEAVASAFRDEGLHVARNTPFAGAHIARAYGAPARNRHVVQIEIDRALYMDEAAIAPHQGYADFKSVMDAAIERLCEIGRARDVSHAAE